LIKKIRRKIYLFLVPFIRVFKFLSWQFYLRSAKEIKINVGAGGTKYKNWFNTDIDTLDVTNEKDFKKYFSKKKIKNILAEHVLEHLTGNDLNLMIMNFLKYSDDNIVIRIAVPDGFHSDINYISRVKPGGTGEGAHDHKNLFNYMTLSELFEKHGFKADLIEYWDEKGNFHSKYKNDDKGYITRSLINDERNKNGKPNYTSLIIDFSKC
jgi:predicted SAM-dependent methyltransferase